MIQNLQPYSKSLVSLALVLLLLSGCTQTKPQQSPSPSAPAQTELSTGKEILAQTETHTLYKTNNQCYLDLNAGNINTSQSSGCLIYPCQLEFASIAEMYKTLMHDPFSEEDIATIQNGFPASAAGFLIPDPNNLCDLHLPEDIEIVNILLQSDRYSFWFRTNGSACEIVGSLTVVPESYFSEQLNTGYDPFKTGKAEYESAVQIPERSATAYTVITEQETYKYILYTLQQNNQTLYIRERYTVASSVDPNTSDTSPNIIDIFGQENGIYYICNIGGYGAAIPSYSLTPYIP